MTTILWELRPGPKIFKRKGVYYAVVGDLIESLQLPWALARDLLLEQSSREPVLGRLLKFHASLTLSRVCPLR